MNQQLTTYEVPFHEETLLVIEDHLGDRFVAMRPVVEALGLNWSGQYLRLNRHPVLSSTVCAMQTVAEDGKDREMVALPVEQFHGWLFTIDASRVKPEAKDKLIAYQMECFDVLHSYFTEGAAWNPRFHRQEFDRTRKIAGKQSMDMAPVAFSVISRAAERVPAHQCVEFAHQALDLANQCLSRGEPDMHAQEHLLKLLLSSGQEQLHPDEVSALTRTTPTQRSKLLRHLDATGFQIQKNAQGLYEHVPPSVASRGSTLKAWTASTTGPSPAAHAIKFLPAHASGLFFVQQEQHHALQHLHPRRAPRPRDHDHPAHHQTPR